MCYTLEISTSLGGDHVVWVTRFPTSPFSSFFFLPNSGSLDWIGYWRIVVYSLFLTSKINFKMMSLVENTAWW